MAKFNVLFRLCWTFLVALTLTLGLAACEGDDGAAGAAGAPGADGSDGLACWDLNGNGTGDEDEDINNDGLFNAEDCGPDADPITARVESAKVESCATCHGGAGDEHQAVYDDYVDASALTLAITSVTSVPDGVGGFDLTVEFSITKDGAPFTDFNGLDERRFYATTYDSATNQYLNGLAGLHEDDQTTGDANNVVMVADGDFVLTKTGYGFDPTVNGHVYGYIAQTPLFEHAGGTGAEQTAGTHVHLYDDVANAALAFGDAQVTDPDAYVSAANVDGCTNCHGTPYLKHGYRDPIVAGLPEFASCKSCHNDDGPGFHQEWQYMVDEPFNWATGVAATRDYSYNRTIMNDVHMSHAMEFPYPQSMSTCNTCHEGKLAQVLDDSNFTAETCLSCHPVQGIDAYPRTFNPDGTEILSRGDPVPEVYGQPHRAPPFEFLWTLDSDLTFHDAVIDSDAPDACTTCHGAAGIAPGFSALHTGYDKSIYDATGTKYADLNFVTIDQITRSGNLLTVNFSSDNPAIVPELYISFYGWDSKHFIVASHTRDANSERMEYEPGDNNPLFTEDAASVPGDWMVTLDMGAYAPIEVLPEDIPTLIDNGVIKKAEISVAPQLTVGDTRVVLKAVNATFDLGGNTVVDNYFKGTDKAVDITKCNACHDALASTFHSADGRAGDGIEVCKNCHVTTNPGGHIEMASRSIDNYVHAIHSFQDFDVDDKFETFDPVLAKRYDQHVKHVFPNFTITNCEACHEPGKYNAPDQSESMPGVLSATSDAATWYMIDTVAGSPTFGLALEDASGRSIGSVPEYVTGPASRACGGCHRARLIRDDAAGDLAAFNAHTEAFGTYVENDTADGDGSDADDEVLYGVIKEIMSLFE